MLVRPSGISASSMHHAKNSIGPNEVPGINRGAAFGWVPHQSFRINRLNSAVDSSRRTAVQPRLVEVDSLVVLGGGSAGLSGGQARSSRQAVASSHCGWIE